MRLDLYIVEEGLIKSRNKAQEAIKSSQVYVNGKVCKKASLDLKETDKIEIISPSAYVSRAGDKLAGFLNQNPTIEIKEQECLDIGSSTGGFVQVLLEKEAQSITCVDVGKDQLHMSLKSDERIYAFEQTDIRCFQADKTFDVVTCDVSFIGLEQILEPIDKLSKKYIIILFKPQFQVGRNIKRNKKGVVKDKEAIVRVMNDFEATTFAMGWELTQKETSIIKGKEGNEETFYCFTKR